MRNKGILMIGLLVAIVVTACAGTTEGPKPTTTIQPATTVQPTSTVMPDDTNQVVSDAGIVNDSDEVNIGELI